MAENLFQGFTIDDDWLDLEEQPIAVPNGFDPLTLYDYSDVGVLINNKSESSKTIGWAFVEARNISLERVFIFDAAGTPTGETINRNQFNEFFAYPFLEMLGNRSNVSDMNYLVTKISTDKNPLSSTLSRKKPLADWAFKNLVSSAINLK